MKKKTIYAILAAVAISCTACGGQTNNAKPDEQNTTENHSPDTADNNLSNTAPDTGNSASEKTDGTPADGTTTESTTANEQQHNPVTLDWQKIENSDTAEDGTILSTCTCTYPIVSIEGNQAAADQINASIQSHVTAFTDDTSVQNFAKEDYVPENPAFIAYNSDLSFSARRSDSNVISFEVIFYEYSGGAHGNYGSIGLNFNARTGEVIDFADLGEDAASFRADTFAFNRALADTEPYQNKMYGETSDEQLESVLYADDQWFLSAEGLTFISDPYALGPYASGAIEFTIPYEELDNMGLKKEYQYDGNLTLKLQDSIPVSMDLNGDGTKETVLTSTVYNDSPDAAANFVTHIFINDIDVANSFNDKLSQLLTDFPWDPLALYDTNPSDDMIELVLITTEYPAENTDARLTSYFFRYEKDGSVSYLGWMNGSILNPETELSITAP